MTRPLCPLVHLHTHTHISVADFVMNAIIKKIVAFASIVGVFIFLMVLIVSFMLTGDFFPPQPLPQQLGSTAFTFTASSDQTAETDDSELSLSRASTFASTIEPSATDLFYQPTDNSNDSDECEDFRTKVVESVVSVEDIDGPGLCLALHADHLHQCQWRREHPYDSDGHFQAGPFQAGRTIHFGEASSSAAASVSVAKSNLRKLQNCGYMGHLLYLFYRLLDQKRIRMPSPELLAVFEQMNGGYDDDEDRIAAAGNEIKVPIKSFLNIFDDVKKLAPLLKDTAVEVVKLNVPPRLCGICLRADPIQRIKELPDMAKLCANANADCIIFHVPTGSRDKDKGFLIKANRVLKLGDRSFRLRAFLREKECNFKFIYSTYVQHGNTDFWYKLTSERKEMLVSLDQQDDNLVAILYVYIADDATLLPSSKYNK